MTILWRCLHCGFTFYGEPICGVCKLDVRDGKKTCKDKMCPCHRRK